TVIFISEATQTVTAEPVLPARDQCVYAAPYRSKRSGHERRLRYAHLAPPEFDKPPRFPAKRGGADRFLACKRYRRRGDCFFADERRITAPGTSLDDAPGHAGERTPVRCAITVREAGGTGTNGSD